jgi:hypothetical protein
MALEQTISFKTQYGDVVVNNVYIKVVQVNATKDHGTAHVRYYKQKDGNLLNEKSLDFPVVLEGKNFIEQAYMHIKTLEEFAQAKDC